MFYIKRNYKYTCLFIKVVNKVLLFQLSCVVVADFTHFYCVVASEKYIQEHQAMKQFYHGMRNMCSGYMKVCFFNSGLIYVFVKFKFSSRFVGVGRISTLWQDLSPG